MPLAGPLSAMGVRQVLALLVGASSMLPGCAGQDGLLTADEAVAIALGETPGGTLVGVYGVEGPQLQVQLPRLAFRDDGLDDGVFGDGRLSSWVVGLRLDGSLVERRIYGDGRPSEFFEGDVPEVFQDMQVFVPTQPRLDSPAAAAVAMDACHLAPVPGKPNGYLYGFSLYDEVARVWPPSLHVAGAVPYETLGLSSSPGLWTVVAIDMTPGSDHVAQTARLDSAQVASTTCATGIPLAANQVFWASDFWAEPLAQPDSRRTYSYPFEVGDRAVHVRGSFWVQGHDQTPPGMHAPLAVATPPVGLLTMADGTVLFDGDAWYRVDIDVATPQVKPGTWTLEASTEGPVGQRMHVGGELWALERLLP